MKIYLKSVSVLFLFVSFALLINSCTEYMNDVQKPSGSVQFKIEKGNVNFYGKGWWQQENMQLNTSLTNPDLLLKTSGSVDEVKILALDMTRWESFEDFYDGWTTGEQQGLFDTSLWNDSRDIWSNLSMLLKSYTGDYYEYVGEINLHIENNVARGSINLNPGINYFVYAFRKDGITVSWGETIAIITEGETNTVRITQESYDMPPEVPSTPHPADGAAGVRLDAVLNWQCSDPEGDTLTYYVYFGPDSDPGWASYQTVNSYNPGRLLPNTKYYWKIEAYDKSYNSSESPVWSFTTSTASSIVGKSNK